MNSKITKLSDKVQDWVSNGWEQFFSRNLSFPTRFLLGALITALEFGLSLIIFTKTGIYFSVIAIVAVILISLFARIGLSLFFAVILCLANDYFFIPPIGSIFDNPRSIEHFIVVCTAALFAAISISSMRSAFEKTTLAKREVGRASKLMEKVLAMVSHDIRNPLSAIQMTTKLILEFPKHSEKHQQFAIRILKSLDRVDSMIQTLLDVSSIRSGKSIPLHFKYCDLSLEVSSILQEMKLIFSDRLRFTTGGPLWGNWSAEGIRRALENLISNAIKYGDTYAPISISLSTQDSLAVINVHNYGNEISDDEKNKLFDYFYRPEGYGTDHTQGWGLGLTVVKGVAEGHGGTALIESSPARGTSFILQLPIRGKLLEAHG